MLEEIWEDIAGYEGIYQVSNMGRVKSLPCTYYRKTDGRKCTRPEIILSEAKTEKGYVRVRLSKDKGCGNKKESVFVHKLVASAFVENEDIAKYNMVNHIDGNKSNNIYTNLEWVNNKENVLHSYRDNNMIHSNAKAVIQYDKDMNEVGRYKTIRQAMEETGFQDKYISKAMKTNKLYKNYYWRKWDRQKEMV